MRSWATPSGVDRHVVSTHSTISVAQCAAVVCIYNQLVWDDNAQTTQSSPDSEHCRAMTVAAHSMARGSRSLTSIATNLTHNLSIHSTTVTSCTLSVPQSAFQNHPLWCKKTIHNNCYSCTLNTDCMDAQIPAHHSKAPHSMTINSR